MSRRFKQSIPLPTDWLNSPVAKDLMRQANEAPTERHSQQLRILKLLLDAQGAEVPLPTIARCAAQYNGRIHVLRRAGFRILNRSESHNGITHSWYRLEISGLEDSTPPGPVSPRSRRAQRPAENMQLFAEGPAPSKPAQPETIWRDPEMGGASRG